ncbi:MAG TPA: phenylalanine--tRNA ligase subunit beta [Candidatus Pristimantibacillus sp.]|nr:phenylalanine--tRNA ligase subunit beta [Candidatus Pristimantibacillus sp.]
MKISTQAIKFINEHNQSAGDPAPNGVDDLLQKIGAQLAAVEDVFDFGVRFKDVIIVKVVSCEDHPNADRLHVCKVDDGGKVEGVERDENGHVQVVCGAPNVHAGMLAAWLPPGATVPSTIADDEPFVLSARDFRGVVSNGMMASPKELSLGDSHEGLLEITEDFGPIEPGTRFADAYHLNDDVIIDMENKMFTHRPDCFGWLGLARELEGIQHRQYKSPEWYKMDQTFPGIEGDELKLEVKNEIPKLVPRFVAIALRDITIGPSPVWLQVDLARVGLRSINNIVDYTNYYMLLTGQPIHAYDYDKVKKFSGGDSAVLTIRFPRAGEKITLLNGKEIEPRAEAMMVAAGDHLACVGGAMGGADTEVDENTKNVIIEAANWDMYSMRKTAMAHGIFTDAVTRFNKGQSPLQNLATVWKITEEIRKFAGGNIASPLIDINNVVEEARDRGNIHAPVKVTAKFINERLGWDLSADEMAKLLTNVEFKVEVNGGELTVTAPFWRTDIEIPEDVVEEVGRLNGYDKLPLDLPKRDLTPAPRNPVLEFKKQVRQILSANGANEVLSYTFVHGNLIDRVGQDRNLAFQVANALSPDLQYFRLSLTPSLLERVHPNIKAGHNQFAIFELNKAHAKGMLDEEGLPREFNRVAFTFAADDKTAGKEYTGAPFYQARQYLENLLAHFGAAGGLEWQPLAQTDFGGHAVIEQMTKPYEPNRSAALVKDGLVVGVVGEYRPSVHKALKLPAFTAGFEVFHAALLGGTGTIYTQLPRFPRVEQDICLKVSSDLSYGELFAFVESQIEQDRPDETFHSLSPVDIYQREDDPERKQITLRLSIASYERTLTDQEITKLLDQVAAAAKETFQAERV